MDADCHGTTIDFVQNVALPHVSSTPSSWYFLSLIWVSVFGVFSENSGQQTNYVYSERTAGKGSNEVISMLHHFGTTSGVYSCNEVSSRVWTIYADNCGGQNKNNHVIRYLLLLVDSGVLKTVNLYFFVRGHTKNNCDRGFGNMKKAYVKTDLYTVDEVASMVDESSTTNKAVNLEKDQAAFKDWKALLESEYRDLDGIQKYQLFSVDASTPGVVHCRKRPTSAPVSQDVRRKKVNTIDHTSRFGRSSLLLLLLLRTLRKCLIYTRRSCRTFRPSNVRIHSIGRRQ